MTEPKNQRTKKANSPRKLFSRTAAFSYPLGGGNGCERIARSEQGKQRHRTKEPKSLFNKVISNREIPHTRIYAYRVYRGPGSRFSVPLPRATAGRWS